ncbi:MAG: twin-arginine translocase subunit TatC [Actinomycetota bacterium]
MTQPGGSSPTPNGGGGGNSTPAAASNLRRRRRLFRRRRQTLETGGTMSVMQHLTELRQRLVWSALAFVTVSVVIFVFYNPLLEFLRGPLCGLDPDILGPQGCDLIFTKPTAGFTFRLKVTAMFGIAFSSPFWIYQIYAFVLPALHPKERRYVVPFIATSTTLFLIGATMAYLVLPTGLRVLFNIGGEGLVPLLGAEEYLDFVGLMLLGFGVLFQLPLILFFLGMAGVVNVQQLRRQRRLALIAIVALSAIITPTQDPFTLLAVSIPLYAMYEATILLLKVTLRRRERDKAAKEAEEAAERAEAERLEKAAASEPSSDPGEDPEDRSLPPV